MRTISYKLDDLKKIVIPIGYEGENNHTRVIIDAGEVFKQYPEAAVALTVQPPKGTMYPAIVTRDGDAVTWDVKDSDCASNGNGEAQFTFTNGTVVVKSVVTKIKVQRSLHTEGPAPDPILSWLDTASETLEEADQAIEAATEAAAAAEAAAEDLEALDDITKAALAGDVGKALSPKTVENGVVTEWQFVEPGAGTDDYTDLDNKPSIAGVTLSGNKTLEDLGIAAADDLNDVAEDVSRALNAIEGVEGSAEKSDGFLSANDFAGAIGKLNVLKVPYGENDMLDSSTIFSNGTIQTGSSYSTNMVSPLIPVSEGKYGLKVVHGNYSMGDIHNGNDYDNGFGFFAADGVTVVARPSHLTALGDNIYVIPVPSGASYIRFTILKGGSTASYLPRSLEYFNQWILLPNADENITSSFFDDVVSPKQNGEIDKIMRSDGSYLELKDTVARESIENIDISGANNFLERNNLDGNLDNILGTPFSASDIMAFAGIMSNGSIRNERNNYDRNTSLTPLIPVEKGKYVLYVPDGSGASGNKRGILSSINDGYGLFASDGTTKVTKESFTALASNIFQIVVPDGASYIRFQYYHGESEQNTFIDEHVEQGRIYINENWVMIKSDSESLTPSDFTKKSNGVINKFVRSDGSEVIISTNELSQKKILVFGDSIWGNDRTDGIADFLAEYCGATIYNCAIGGTRITGDRDSYSGGPEWTAFDGKNLIHAKIIDTWTEQDQYAGDVASYVATETLPLLKSVDMDSVDIVILEYGANDFTGGKTIAQITAAYEDVIEEILTEYPHIRILICTSTWREFKGTDGDVYENSQNYTIRQMDDGIIEMAKAKHITVVDMLSELPWRAETKEYYLDADYVHPNIKGNRIYAHVVHGKLRSMY